MERLPSPKAKKAHRSPHPAESKAARRPSRSVRQRRTDNPLRFRHNPPISTHPNPRSFLTSVQALLPLPAPPHPLEPRRPGPAGPPPDARAPAVASAPRDPLTLPDLIAQLRARGLRLTPSRRAMLAALLHCSAPVTLTQLQHSLRPERVALATLFRSMLRLEAVELVTRTIDLHGTTNWELNVGRRRAFHLTHPASGTIIPLDPLVTQPLHDLLARIGKRLRERGYRHLQLSVAFRGAPAHPALPPYRVA